MSVSDSRLPTSVSDDIWHQNKAEIRNLYQNQRKTLKEIKHLMELKGFPETPLSTWEAKLRDVLQLRKKAKATDWPLIYQHVLPRLEEPGHKGLRKRTAIYLNGSEIPWNKAWKEIRRSGAMKLPLRQGPPSPLPSGLVIRTPSPVPGLSTPTARASQLTGGVVATHFKHTTQDLTLRDCSGMLSTAHIPIGNDESRSLAQYAVSVYQDCAATIPWVDLYQALEYLFHGPQAAWQLDGHSNQEGHELSASIVTNHFKTAGTQEGLKMNFQPFFDLLPAGKPIPPRPSHDLGCRVSISAARLQINQFISTTIYLLSNLLYDGKDGDKGLELFCSILERRDRQAIKLLHSRLPSIRAAWGALLLYSVSSRRRDTFRLLIDVGIRDTWLTSQPVPGVLLCYAVETDCIDTIKDLVNYGCRSCSEWWTESFDAIIAAIRGGKKECARLLVRDCDFSARTWWRGRASIAESEPSRFQGFIREIDIHNVDDMRALEFLLTVGANVDEPFSWANLMLGSEWYDSPIEFYYGSEIDDWMRLTILDYNFYFDRPVYEKLAPYSKVSESDISRTGLLLALKGGTAALGNYLEARVTGTLSPTWQPVHSYLELITAEQFMLQDDDSDFRFLSMGRYPPRRRGYREIDLQLVRVLIDHGVDLALPSIAIDIQDLLVAVLNQLFRQCTDDGLELVTMLVRSRARIMGQQLRMVVTDQGFKALECLALLVDDFPAKAVLALAEAARLDNFEAVEFLLGAGVDPCSFVPGEELADRNMKDSTLYSVQAIAAVSTEKGTSASSEMMECLAKHGARLVVTPDDSSPFDFTHHLLQFIHSDTVRKVKYALQLSREHNQFTILPSYLLEKCVNPRIIYDDRGVQILPEEEVKARLELFKYLLSQGASVSPGPCLAALICAGGSAQLVEKVVHFGADLNAYCFSNMPGHWCKRTPLQASAGVGNEDLVRILLAAGSNVNSPACGEHGQTALQAICDWDTATEEEYDRKMRICQLLINEGANVNAAPARVKGQTALQYAVRLGHLEIAALVLRNGARINDPSCLRESTALDVAVRSRRLDTVKFLLNANALSYFRGATGYDGALEFTLADGHRGLAIADLIREHAANNIALGLINPELLKPQEDYHVYGYVNNGKDYIYTSWSNYDPDALREDCTTRSLCTYCSGIARDEE